MITFETEINNKKVRLYSNAPLKRAATALLRTLKQLTEQTNIFTPNFALNFGWARYYLSKRQDKNVVYYVVQTADYRNDPMNLRTDDCTDALIIQNMQVDTNNKANVSTPEPTLYSDTIMILKEALDAEDVYMDRVEKTINGVSGWRMGLLNDEKEGEHVPEDFVTIRTSELIKIRNETLRVLQMPVGTLANFHGNTMTALIDKDDNLLDFTTEDDRKRAIAQREAAESVQSESAE